MRTPRLLCALALLVVSCRSPLRDGESPSPIIQAAATAAAGETQATAETFPAAGTAGPPDAGRTGVLSIAIEGPVGAVPAELPVRLMVTATDRAGVPLRGLDLAVRVTDDDGKLVYGAADLREPLGAHRFWVGPLAPGAYHVQASASASDATPADEAFADTLEKGVDLVAQPGGFGRPALLALAVEGQPKAGVPAKVTFSVKNPQDGNPILHSDNHLRIGRNGALPFRLDGLEAGGGTQTFQYTFPEPGKYQVALTSFPVPGRSSVSFAPTAKTIEVEVTGEPSSKPAPTPAPPPGPTPTAVPTATPGRPRLALQIDPPLGPVAAELGPRFRLTALDAAGLPIGGATMELEIKDPTGATVFQTSEMRAPLGVQEAWVGPLRRGRYRVLAKATASSDTPKLQADAMGAGLLADARIEALPAGLVMPAEQTLSVDGAPTAGIPTNITFGVASADDHQPILESDHYLTIFRDDGLVVYQSGDVHPRSAVDTIAYTFVTPGTYTLALTTQAEPLRSSVPFTPLGKSLAVTVAPAGQAALVGPPTTVSAATAAVQATPGAAQASATPPTPPAVATTAPTPVVGTATPAGPTAATLPSTPRPAPAPVVEVAVHVKDLTFDPSTIEVQRGSKITLVFDNSSILAHNLTLPGLGVGTPTLDGGQKGKWEFTVDRPGEYEYVCTVLGHREAGMTGKLVVK